MGNGAQGHRLQMGASDAAFHSGAQSCPPCPHPPPLPSFHKGYLSVNFSSNYYLLSQRHAEVPRLTPAHLEVGWDGWEGPGWLGGGHSLPTRRCTRCGQQAPCGALQSVQLPSLTVPPCGNLNSLPSISPSPTLPGHQGV